MSGRKGNTLDRWEVAIVKAMQARGGLNDQEILAYFTRPQRTVNHRLIGEIRTDKRHKTVKTASDVALDEFLATWPDIDPATGLSVRGDELLIKAREAMIAAVHTFNGAGLNFRAELFIVTAVIAWTYLMHAYYRREGIDYRYKNSDNTVKLTPRNAEKFWELGTCLRHAKCPVGKSVVQNLEFLLELRHEIEHRSTSRIDDAVSAKLQACCINFNDAIKSHFGARYALERRLPIALQFVTFDSDQRALLKKASTLPANIAAMMDAFHDGMTEEEQADPAFAYRTVFIPRVGARASKSDEAIQFITSDSTEGREIARVLLRDVDKRRYSPTQIVDLMHMEGFPKFRLQEHTELWQSLDAKNPGKGFGKAGVYKGTWEWFDSWLARVRAHCQENAGRYR
jgi:hypothetical protein